MRIITISGKARHGKDSTAEILKEHFEEKGKSVLIVHYADYLKFVCHTYFGWNGVKDEAGRKILQVKGTDEARKRNPNIWLNVVLQLLSAFGDNYDYILIPDCRFPNEIEGLRVEGFDVFCLWIYRINFDNGLTEEQKNHPSETSLDKYRFDAVISSESGLYKLREKVIRFVTSKGW